MTKCSGRRGSLWNPLSAPFRRVSLLMRIAGVPTRPKIFRAIKPICIFGSGGIADSSRRRDKSTFQPRFFLPLSLSLSLSPAASECKITGIARINCNTNFSFFSSFIFLFFFLSRRKRRCDNGEWSIVAGLSVLFVTQRRVETRLERIPARDQIFFVFG